MNKYVYFVPQGGLNDIFTCIQYILNYCIQYNRILLLDMTKSCYEINFSDYFYIENCNIIYDIYKIKNIVSNKKLSVYPKLDFDLIDIQDKNIVFKEPLEPGHINPYFRYNNIVLDLPDNEKEENIILTSQWGGGKGWDFFINNVCLTETSKDICKQKLIFNNYLCIQVRNTDYQCNYIQLYEENKELIHSFNEIYICTDNKLVVDYFKTKNLNIFCFTTFPTVECINLHYSNVPSNIKIQDVLVDIFMATNSIQILSNSEGWFIHFLRNCFLNKDKVLNKIKKSLPIKLLIIQTSPSHTASTILANAIHGLIPSLCDKKIIYDCDLLFNTNFIEPIIAIKTHITNIDEIINKYKNNKYNLKYKIVFICSEKQEIDKLMDPKYKLYNNVVIFDFNELNETPTNTLIQIVDTIYNKVSNVLPNIILNKITCMNRINLMKYK